MEEHKAYFEKPSQKLGYKPEVIRHGKDVYTGVDQVGKLCRDLRSGTLKIYRGEMLCLTVDVKKRAGRSLRDDKKIGLVNTLFREFDKSKFHKNIHGQD